MLKKLGLSIDTTHTPPPVPLDSTFKPHITQINLMANFYLVDRRVLCLPKSTPYRPKYNKLWNSTFSFGDPLCAFEGLDVGRKNNILAINNKHFVIK